MWLEFIREEKCENKKIKRKKEMKEIKWERIWGRFLQHDKVCVYVGWLGYGRSEISHPVIQLNLLNYLSNSPKPTCMSWVRLGCIGAGW